MKGYYLGVLFFVSISVSNAQDQEVKQLLLNVEKLEQLRSILEQMKGKYQILSQGFQQIQQINQEGFELHSLFLDRLTKVNPKVRTYHKIAEVIEMQIRLFDGMNQAIQKWNLSDYIAGNELNYLEESFLRFRKMSWRNLEEMALLLSDQQLQLTDSERIKGIDRIHEDMNRMMFGFLRMRLTLEQIEEDRNYRKIELNTLKSILNYD